MNTLESIVALDLVLDHSEVMTALRGYSAPMPGKRQYMTLQRATRESFGLGCRTYSHDEAPPREQGKEVEVIIAPAARGDADS